MTVCGKPQLAVLMSGVVAVAITTFAPAAGAATGGLEGHLSCTAGEDCVYTVHNPGTQTSYLSYGSETFPWGDAHFAGGGCIAPGQTVSQVSFTHNGRGVPRTPAADESAPFALPYMPHDNRCP